MKNKFISFLLQDIIFNIKVGVFILLIISAFFLYKNTAVKRVEASKLRQDMNMIQVLEKQILVLEENIKALEVKAEVKVVLKRNANLVLKGIVARKGESVVLINNDIYQKNDMVDGLMITEISSRTVTLQDPFTAEKSQIQLPE